MNHRSAVPGARSEARDSFLRWGGAVAVGVLTWSIYAFTLAGTVTWANEGSDGAELAAAAWVWGVAHPPGYPLYLTLARLFQYLPLGDPAFRATVFSAVMAVLTAMVTYATLLELLQARKLQRRNAQAHGTVRADLGVVIGAAFGALLLAFGTLLWSQAVIVEVYTFGALLFALWLLLLARWINRWRTADDRRPTAETAGHTGCIRWAECGHIRARAQISPEVRARGHAIHLGLIGLCLGLLASHQPNLGLAALPTLALAWRRGAGTHAILWFLAGLGAGVSVLLTVWVRATFQPPINWGDPSALDRWVHHITAADYGHYLYARTLQEKIHRLPYAGSILIRQSGWPGVFLAAWGMVWLWRRQRDWLIAATAMGAFAVLWMVVYDVEGSTIYLLPAAHVLAIAAGLGAAHLLRQALTCRQRPFVAGSAFALLASLVAWQVITTWSLVDASGDLTARRWGMGILASAPERGVVRTQNEAQTFVLWYLQEAEGMRRGVAVVDERLLACCPWYVEQLTRRFPWLVDQSGPGSTP